MQSDPVQKIQELAILSPQELESPEWKAFINDHPECRKELKLLKNTLEIYRQIAPPLQPQLADHQIVEALRPKLQQWERQHLRKTWSYRFLAAAAMILVVVSALMVSPLANRDTAENEPNAKIIAIESGIPFGPPNAEMQIVWTKEHFGLSLQNNEENYTPISIGMKLNLQQSHAQSTLDNFARHLAKLDFSLPKIP